MTSVPSNSRAPSAPPRIPVSKLTLKASLDLRNVGMDTSVFVISKSGPPPGQRRGRKLLPR